MAKKNAKLPVSASDQALVVEPKLTVSVRDKRAFSDALGTFLDITATSTGRASFYNTKEEQEVAEVAAHEKMFLYDRTLYGALLTLPSVTDRAKQHGMLRLLSDRTNGGALSLVGESVDQIERKILATLADDVSVPRLMKAFLMLRDAKVNNGRSRRFVLRTLLRNKGLEIRAVRYRDKFGDILRHVFGKKKASVLRAILERPRSTWEKHEVKFVKDQLETVARFSDDNIMQVSIAYALGSDSEFVQQNTATSLIKAVFEARHDLTKGKDLPVEILEGIRSHFHKETKRADIMEMAAASKTGMTNTQRMQLQASAQKAGVVTPIEFDPLSQDSVKLYVYAYERGMTESISDALDKKARDGAATLPARYGKVGIVMDDSLSMMGNETQKLRPMAIALATRDVLAQSGDQAVINYASGRDQGRLPQPSGDTSLAEALVETLIAGVDIVYIISDGYENAPAGRVSDTIERIRSMGIETPIIQMSPVAAAEAKDDGLRQLSDEVKTIPVSNPQAMGTNMLRTLVVTDPQLAASVLLKLAFETKSLGNLSEIKKLEG